MIPTLTNRRSTVRSSGLGCLILLGLASIALAQAPAASSSRDDATKIERVYVPADELNVILSCDREGVLMPQREFAALLQRVAARTNERPKGWVAPQVTAARYEARLDGDRLLVTANIDITSFSSHWAETTLPVMGLSVESVRHEGVPLLVARADKDHLKVFSQRNGTMPLTLELSTALRSIGGDVEATFGLAGPASGQLVFHVEPGKHLFVDGLRMQRPQPIDQPADYAIPIGGRQQIAIRVSDRQVSERSDLVTFASTAYGLRVSPGDVTWVAQTEMEVFGRSLDRIECHVPTLLEITRVESPGLESWELSQDPDAPETTRITLDYRQPFDGRRGLTFYGVVAAPPSEPWRVPPLSIQGVSAHTGAIVVTYPAGVRLQTVRTQGVRPVGGDAMDSSRSLQARFEVWQEDFELSFNTTTKPQEVQAAMTNLLVIGATGINLTTTVDLIPRFTPLFEIQVRLPAERQLTSVVVDNKPSDWTIVPAEAGINEVRIPLASPIPPGQPKRVTITSWVQPEEWPVEEGTQQIAIPEVRLPQVGLLEAVYGIVVDNDLNARPIEVTGLEPAVYRDLQQLNQKLSQIGRQARLAYSYQDTRISGQLEISRKAASVAAQTVTSARLDRETSFVAIESTLTINGGGVRQIRVALPESVPADLRFSLMSRMRMASPVKIVEQQAAEPQDGQRIWTLFLDRYFVGTAVLQTTIQQPRDDDGAFSLPRLEILDAQRENGFLAVEAAPEQQIQVDTAGPDGEALPIVDPVDFPPTYYQPQERVVAAHRYAATPWTATITEQRFEPTAVPTAVIRSLDLTTNVSGTGTTETRATAHLSAVGIQSIVLELPEENELWSVIWDGEPIEVRKTAEGYQIPVTHSEDPAAQHHLDVFYSSSGAPLPAAGEWSARPPAFWALDGARTRQHIEVLQAHWEVRTPDETRFLMNDGVFEPAETLTRPTFVSELKRLLKSQDPDRLLRNVLIAIVFAGILAGLRRIWSRGWVGRLLIGGLALTGLAVLCIVSGVLFRMGAAPTAGYMADSVSLTAEPAARTSPAPEGMAGGFGGGGYGDMPMSESEIETAPAPVDSAAIDALELEAKDKSSLMDERLFQQERGEAAAKPEQLGAQLSDRFDEKQTPPAQPNSPAEVPQLAVPQSGMVAREPDDSEPQGRFGGALLSLKLDLDMPENARVMRFQYDGSALLSASNTLRFHYVNARTQQMLFCTLATGILLLSWWFRKRGPCFRAVWLITVVGLPLIAFPLIPVALEFVLQGIFVGGLLGALFWLALDTATCIGRCCRAWCFPSVSTGGAILLSLGALTGTGQAEEVMPTTANAVPVETPAPRRVIVPYTDVDALSTSERVFVPSHLFRELWERAHPEDPVHSEMAPTTPVLVEAIYAGKIVNPAGTPRLRVQGRIVIAAADDSRQSVTLPIQGVALRSATLDDRDAVISGTADGNRLSIVVESKGLHLLDVEFDLPAQLTGPAGEFEFHHNVITSGRFEFELPTSEAVARVNGGTNTYRRRETDDGTTIEFPVDQPGTYRVSWQPKQQVTVSAETVQVDTTRLVELDDAGLHLRFQFQYRVRQGSLSEVAYRISPDLLVRKVSGPELGGWELEDPEEDNVEHRILRIFLRREVTASTELTVDVFHPVVVSDEQVSITLPDVEPIEATREIGSIAVFAADQFQVRSGQTQGLIQVDASTLKLPSPTRPTSTSPRLTYRYTSRPHSLELLARRRAPETTALVEHSLFLARRRTRVVSRFDIELRGAPRPGLTLQLPRDFVLIDVTSAELADWYRTDAEEGDTSYLTVEFHRPMTGRVGVLLEGHFLRDPASDQAALAVPAALDVTRTNVTLGVWVDDSFEAALEDDGGWRSIPVDRLPQTQRQLRSDAPKFAFETTATMPQPLAFRLRQLEPEIDVDMVSLIAVTDATVDYGFTIRWRIDRARTDTLSFRTPEWLGSQIEFTSPGIRQVLSEEPDAGEIAWTLQLTTPVRGDFLASAVVTLPPRVDQQVLAPRFTFERTSDAGQSTPIAIQRQFAILVNLSSDHIVPVNPDTIQTVTRDDIPLKLHDDLVQQAMQLVVVREDAAPTWQVQRAQQTQVASASVLSANLVTVLEIDGSWRTQATYGIRNRGHQFLALELPEGSRILSVVVRHQPTRAVHTELDGRQVELIALPQTSAADLSFDVRVILAGQQDRSLTAPLRWTGQELTLPAPHILTPKESAAHGLSTAQTTWSVYVPDSVTAIPLRDVQQTNLTWHASGEGGYAVTLQQLDRFNYDIAEMIRVAKDASVSDRQRAQAVSNLKRIEQQLQSTSEYGWYEPAGEVSRQQLLEQKVQSNRALLEQAKQDLGGEDFGFNTTQQAQATNDFTFNGGRFFCASNNTILLNNNGFSGTMLQDDESESSGFQVERLFDGPNGPRRQLDGATKEERGRTLLRKRLSEQSPIQRFNTPGQISGGGGVGGSSTMNFSDAITDFDAGGLAVPQNQAEFMFGVNGLGSQNSPFDGVQEHNIRLGRRGGEAAPQGLAVTRGVTITGTVVAPPAWKSAGGLSINFELPVSGTPLEFSKSGGAPRLTLSVRPQFHELLLVGAAWALFWLIAITIIVRMSRKSHGLTRAFGLAALLLIACGLAGFLLTAGDVHQVFFALFVVGCLIMVFLPRRAAAA